MNIQSVSMQAYPTYATGIGENEAAERTPDNESAESLTRGTQNANPPSSSMQSGALAPYQGTLLDTFA